jgi:hypothetical protein
VFTQTGSEQWTVNRSGASNAAPYQQAALLAVFRHLPQTQSLPGVQRELSAKDSSLQSSDPSILNSIVNMFNTLANF